MNRFDLYRAIRTLPIEEQQSLYALLTDDMRGDVNAAGVPVVARPTVGRPSKGARELVLELMSMNEGSATTQQILTYVQSKRDGISYPNVAYALKALKAKGEIENPAYGVWQLITSGVKGRRVA